MAQIHDPRIEGEPLNPSPSRMTIHVAPRQSSRVRFRRPAVFDLLDDGDTRLRAAVKSVGAILGVVLMLSLVTRLFGMQNPAVGEPSIPREFRAAWVATVANIDWPSKKGLTPERQRAELIAILDTAVRLKLNAIVFQVRPAADALYDSKLEPWSEYITGTQGKGPGYDPLTFVVEESHRRGLELHAWFNPYRARHSTAKSPLAPNHLKVTNPLLVKEYGDMLWMDPGEPAVQDRSLNVILDVVKRYDLDGIHIDDYFYPYRVKDASGAEVNFPDDLSWMKYQAAGGKLNREDWRRKNVDDFVEKVYKETKALKPWVKFGISPFGIARPGLPSQIKGFDQYVQLYADVEKWLKNGWADYFSPQLYWKIEQTAQSYPVLLQWWVANNAHKRHIWPGNFTSRVGENGQGWDPREIEYQIRTTRGIEGAGGNVHFSMKVFLEDRSKVNETLAKDVYSEDALIPASPWLDNAAPSRPRLNVSTADNSIKWTPGSGEKATWWALQVKSGGKWQSRILPAWQTTDSVKLSGKLEAVAVSAIDRCGNQGPSATFKP